MKWKIVNLLFILCLSFSLSCEDYLSIHPYGSTSFKTLTYDISGADALLIAAYSNLDGVYQNFSGFVSSSNWVFGSIAGGDAYKGSEHTLNDQNDITPIETRNDLVAENTYLKAKWKSFYNGIARANDAIRAFKAVKDISGTLRNKRIAEARFLRGFYFFNLYEIFQNIPYFDESAKDVRVGNYNSKTGKYKYVLPEIENDFKNASFSLPYSQIEPGRVTKGAALSFLGICKMWEDTPDKYARAKVYFDSVIKSGHYALLPSFEQNFKAIFNNREESILEVQQSINDGTPNGENGGWGDILNNPFGGPGGWCCGFHQPSQNLVNAFKTDPVTGLPLLNSYNNSDVTNDEGIESNDSSYVPYSGTLDPRLDWTVGRRDIPYFDWGNHPGKDWIRDKTDYYGPYSPKKYVFSKFERMNNYEGTVGWTSGPTAINFKLLRYADVLLMAAEAEVELNHLDVALKYVNMIRKRARDGAWVLKNGVSDDGSHVNPAANYFIKTYSSFPNRDYAIRAVRFERRLELGMEGHRFFDLVRWGVADSVMNAYFKAEGKKRIYLTNAKFKKGVNEVFPIPEAAILNSYKNNQPTLHQNPGY